MEVKTSSETTISRKQFVIIILLILCLTGLLIASLINLSIINLDLIFKPTFFDGKCHLYHAFGKCHRKCFGLESNRTICEKDCSQSIPTTPCDTFHLKFIPINMIPGTEKHVISFSLYGNDPNAFKNLASVIEHARQIYPDWIIRFYVSNDLPKDVTDLLLKSNVEIVLVIPTPPNCPSPSTDQADTFFPPGLESDINPITYHASLWRFFVADDQDVKRYIIRDVNSYLYQREKDAVDDWISDETSFHIMRDGSTDEFEILGGLWGGITDSSLFSPKKVYNQALELYCQDGEGADKKFLRKYLWPIVKSNMTCHASVEPPDESCKDFPTSRTSEEFVGNTDALRESSFD